MRNRADYLLSAAGKAASAVLGVVSSAFYIRYLGLSLKGDYAYINEVASILAIVFSLGLHQSYLRQTRLGTSGLPGRYGRIYLCVFFVLLALCGALSALAEGLGGVGVLFRGGGRLGHDPLGALPEGLVEEARKRREHGC